MDLSEAEMTEESLIEPSPVRPEFKGLFDDLSQPHYLHLNPEELHHMQIDYLQKDQEQISNIRSSIETLSIPYEIMTGPAPPKTGKIGTFYQVIKNIMNFVRYAIPESQLFLGKRIDSYISPSENLG